MGGRKPEFVAEACLGGNVPKYLGGKEGMRLTDEVVAVGSRPDEETHSWVLETPQLASNVWISRTVS